jgi:hypothetical protein
LQHKGFNPLKSHPEFRAMQLPLAGLFPGVVVYVLWLIFAFFIDGCSSSDLPIILAVSLVFLAISVLSTICYFLSSRPRQLFHSNRSILLRTSHARVVPVSSVHPRCVRSSLGAHLRGAEQSPRRSPGQLDVIELDVWQVNSFAEGIVVMFSPVTAALGFTGLGLLWKVVLTLGFAAFMFVFVNHVRTAVEDERIIGEELFRTHRNATRDRLDRAALQEHSGQLLQKRANYRGRIPQYGPGAELAQFFDFQESDSASEYESDSDGGRRSPQRSWAARIREAT